MALEYFVTNIYYFISISSGLVIDNIFPNSRYNSTYKGYRSMKQKHRTFNYINLFIP